MVVGQNIKKVRTDKKMSQIELAAIIHSQKASMSRIEAGQSNLKVLSLYHIACALKVSIPDLLEDVKEVRTFDQDESRLLRRERLAQYSNYIIQLNRQFKEIMAAVGNEKDYLKRIELYRKGREVFESMGKVNQKVSQLIKDMRG